MAMTPEEKAAAIAEIEADRKAHPELELSPEDAAKAAVTPGVGTSLGAMAYKGLSGMTGGLSDYFWDAILPRWAQLKLENAVKNTNPLLTTGAEIAGIARSPLAKAGELIRGAKTAPTLGRIGTAALKGAAGAAAYAAPKAAIQAATGERPTSEALADVLKQAATGGAIGGAGEAVFSGLSGARKALTKFAPRLGEKLNETSLNAIGVDADATARKFLRGSDEALAAEGGTTAIKNADAFVRQEDALKSAATDLIQKNGIKSWQGLKDFIQSNLDNPEVAGTPGFDFLKLGLSMGKKGSDISKTLKNAALGTVAGGAVGLSTKKFDLKDPSTWAAAGVGALAGAAAPRLLSQASALKKYLPAAAEEAPQAVEGLGKARNVLQGVASKAPAMLAAVKGATTPDIKAIQDTETQVTPEAQAAAKAQVNDQYVAKIRDALLTSWTTKYAAQGVDYEDFVKAVAARTNDFDPKKSAALLFSDKAERAKFLRDYDLALRLQATDVGEAYKGKKASMITQLFGGGNAAEAKSSYDSLVDLLASTMAKEGSLPTATERKAVEADLAQIMALPPSAGDKKALLLQKLSDKYGFSLTNLKELGLI